MMHTQPVDINILLFLKFDNLTKIGYNSIDQIINRNNSNYQHNY